MNTATPWERGRMDGREGPPQLLFGRMNEDWRIEASLFPPGGRVFGIASAGCVALALGARGFRVTAVDVNPAQIEYARARAGGASARTGLIDRRLANAHRVFPWLGLRKRQMRRFLELSSPEEQIAFWRRHFNTFRFAAFLRCGLSAPMLRLTTSRSLVATVPERFDRVVRQRLERTFAHHANCDNPFVWRLLSGSTPAPEEQRVPNVDFVCADAAQYLESCPPGSFDGFTLSNIVESVPPEYQERLMAAVRRTAAPGARVIVRSLAEGQGEAAEWAAKDRSPLWGTVDVSVC